MLIRNGKYFASCKLNSYEINMNNLNIVKKKFVDNNNPNKIYGFIRFRA